MEDGGFDFFKCKNHLANWFVDLWTVFVVVVFGMCELPAYGWHQFYDAIIFSLVLTGVHSSFASSLKNLPLSRFWLFVYGDGEKVGRVLIAFILLVIAACFVSHRY